MWIKGNKTIQEAQLIGRGARYYPFVVDESQDQYTRKYDNDIENRSLEVNKDRGYKLLSKVPNIVANSYHILNNEEPIEPLKELSYSANFFYMLTGKKPTELEEKIFDRSLVLYSEHEMPNSTFTARVIASTQSDLYGALTGAVASLKGSLHGGANEAVMYMLLEAGNVEKFEELLQKKLYNKEKIMGFGHRVYMKKMDPKPIIFSLLYSFFCNNKEKIMGFGHRVYMKKMDPRALMMKEALKQLCDVKGDYTLYEMCEAGEKIMEKEKGIYPNLDYYAAPVYWMLGIPIQLYTPIFFSSRTVGLCAHVIEQHANNRLFRPRVNYIGERHVLSK